ncbi:MAG: hypothetical protein Q7R88_02380 [bacterium]|nr:hypothetical protein [bacterium]
MSFFAQLFGTRKEFRTARRTQEDISSAEFIQIRGEVEEAILKSRASAPGCILVMRTIAKAHGLTFDQYLALCNKYSPKTTVRARIVPA